MVPVGEGSGLIRWPMSGMLMVSGEIWAWTGLTGDSGTFLGSFLSLERAVNVILILVLGNRKQHLQAGEEPQMRKHTFGVNTPFCVMFNIEDDATAQNANHFSCPATSGSRRSV